MSSSGDFKHVVWADQPVAAQDAATGSEMVTFVPRWRMRCRIEPISGREALRADQIIADMDTRIVVRWSLFAAQINAKWRLRFQRNGTSEIIYNIARPPAERNLEMREIEFMCNSGKNDG